MHSNCLRVDRYHPSFSLVLGIGNQIQVIANSSDSIGGVPIWNTTLSIPTPEASDWRSRPTTRLAFCSFRSLCLCDERQIQRLTHGDGATCTWCPWLLAIVDTAGGRSVPRYVLWSHSTDTRGREKEMCGDDKLHLGPHSTGSMDRGSYETRWLHKHEPLYYLTRILCAG